VWVLAARGGESEGVCASGVVGQLFEPLLTSASADLRAELLSGPAALVEPLVGASPLAALQEGAPAGLGARGPRRARGAARRCLAARRFTRGARRGLVRDPPRPLLARGQRGLSAADA